MHRAMHARVSKLEGLPEQVEELGRIATEWLAPSLSEMEGFHAILALADRQSGKVELVTLWESEKPCTRVSRTPSNCVAPPQGPLVGR